jgi:MoxR-like ATPase
MHEHAATVKNHETIDFGQGSNRVSVLSPEPDTPPDLPFLGERSLIRNCLAAWAGGLSFRLEGPPGVGKNSLVYELARLLQKPIFLMVGTGDLEPQDLVCTPRLTQSPDGRYVASPLVAAMLRPGGSIFFLDEIGKLSERALSVLVSVLDERRSVSSVVAGFSLTADPNFRFCAAMNPTDPPLPDYVEKRLRPLFKVGYPSPGDLTAILQARFSGSHAALLDGFRTWMADKDGGIAPRDAITMLEFAQALAREHHQPLGRSDAEDLIEQAADHVLVRG